MRPVPARTPWFIMRARLALLPGLSEEYQERISRTRVAAPRVGAGGAPAPRSAVTVAFGFMGPSIGRSRWPGKGR